MTEIKTDVIHGEDITGQKPPEKKVDSQDVARARQKILKRFKGNRGLETSSYLSNGEVMVRATSGSAEKIYEKDFRMFEDLCLFLGGKADFNDLMVRNLVAFKEIYGGNRHDFTAVCNFLDIIYNAFVIAQEDQNTGDPDKIARANVLRERMLDILHNIKNTAQSREWQKRTPENQKINLIEGRKSELLGIIGQYLGEAQINASRLNSMVWKLRHDRQTPENVTADIRNAVSENEEAA